ncbi:MAG: tyrosine-type recombinase/integrase [Paraclostridium sp.]
MRVEPIKDLDLIRDMIIYLDSKSQRNKILFSVGIYTGLRISDILKLRVKDIYKKNRLEIKQTKTGNLVYVPINPYLKKMISEYVEDNNMKSYDLLFRSKKGRNKAITRQQAYNVLNEVAAKFKIENIGCHSMRKTSGYHMYYATGKDIGLVMELLGQKDQGSTLRYIGITDMDIEKGINKLKFF